MHLIERSRWLRLSIAVVTALIAVGAANGQTISLPALSGPTFVCQPAGMTVSAGGVVATYSAGQIGGTDTEPRFEATPTCGNSKILINLNHFVKNIQVRVSASVRPFRVAGGGSVNPGQQAFITVAGPRSSIDVSASTSGGVVRVDMISFELADEPALFAFVNQPLGGRVLIHKYRSDDAYPSSNQTQDGQIKIHGLVHNLNGTAGIAGRQVYFRLIDPADTADYVVRNHDAFPNDNLDGPGTLNNSSTATAVSDGSGNVDVTLGITSFAAGDNYQIEASLEPNFNCAPTQCAKSIVYTAWKRVYVEVHKMFRRGTYIRQPAMPGDKFIVVDNTNGFPNVPFDIRLLHASQVEDLVADFYSETVRIVRVRPNQGNDGVQLVLAGEGDDSVPGLQHSYADQERVFGQFRSYLRDAVGVVTGDRERDYLLPNVRYVNATFEDAFVEHVWLTDSVAGVDDDLLASQPRMPFDGAIPFRAGRMGEQDLFEQEWTTRKWLRNVTRTKAGNRVSSPNHQALFTGSRSRYVDAQKSVNYGLTTVADKFNDTWLFALEGSMKGTKVLGEAAVHELAHQWRVNSVKPATEEGADGHCNMALGSLQKIYNRSHLNCQMTSFLYGSDDATDGTVGFHYLKTDGKPVDSEYLFLRKRNEPVPQTQPLGRNPV